MKKLLAGTTIALLFGGAAVAQEDGMVTISVDGEEVEVSMVTAMEVCPDVDVAELVGTGEVACEIDQATADAHGIAADDGAADGYDLDEGDEEGDEGGAG